MRKPSNGSYGGCNRFNELEEYATEAMDIPGIHARMISLAYLDIANEYGLEYITRKVVTSVNIQSADQDGRRYGGFVCMRDVDSVKSNDWWVEFTINQNMQTTGCRVEFQG